MSVRPAMRAYVRRSIAGVAAALGLAALAVPVLAVSGTTTIGFSVNPAPLVAGTDVILTTTTTSSASASVISAGKVQVEIATDGVGNPVPAASVVTWVRIDGAILGGGGGQNPNGSGQTSLAVDLDALSSLGLGLSNVACGDTVGFRAHYVTGGGSVKVDTHLSIGYDLQTTCGCEAVEEGDALTRSHGFYGNKNGQEFLDDHVSSLVVGAGNTLSFTSSTAIGDYMNATPNGTPGQLAASHVDPTTATEAGIFGKQVTALKLNVIYDTVNADGNFGGLTFLDPTSPFDGMTVAEILAEAERVLGGGALLAGSTLGGSNNSAYEYVVDQLNLSFDNATGAPSSWALAYLFDCGGN